METILKIQNLTKKFPGVIALDDINLKILKGDVHVILGENGAGKSTLIKAITGANTVEQGKIFFNNNQVVFNAVRDSINMGIGCIYQELKLFPELSVKENIFIGNELRKSNRLIDWKEIEKKTVEVLKLLGMEISPDQKVEELGMGKQQMVEIAKCLVKNAKLIIMDEPTSSLSSKEIAMLYKIIDRLKDNDVTIIFISHKMDEVMHVADKISVLKDGRLIGTVNKQDTTPNDLVNMMVGRSFTNMFPKNNAEAGVSALEVSGFSSRGLFDDINIEVKTGEVVGMYGVVGAGRTELARAIFGADNYDKGSIRLFGKPVKIKSPEEAINNGIAFLTENRKEEGLILENSVEYNINLTNLMLQFKRKPLFPKKLKALAETKVTELRIKTPGLDALCMNLSGGNQQKVVIAKWLLTKSKIYIIDEPTRGIDVGAKVEVYQIIKELVETGCAVLMISSELEEIIRVCDRIYVMQNGKIAGEYEGENITEDNIIFDSIGGVVE